MANRTQIILGDGAMKAIQNTANEYAKQGKAYGSFAERFAGADVQLGDRFLEPDAEPGIFGTASDIASRLAIQSARNDEAIMANAEQIARTREERIAMAEGSIVEEAGLSRRASESSRRLATLDNARAQRLSTETSRVGRIASEAQRDAGTKSVVANMRADVSRAYQTTPSMRRDLDRVDTQQAMAEWRTRGWGRGVLQMLSEPFRTQTPDEVSVNSQLSAARKSSAPITRPEALHRANLVLEGQRPKTLAVRSRSSDLAAAYKILDEQDAARKAKQKALAKK